MINFEIFKIGYFTKKKFRKCLEEIYNRHSEIALL